MWSILFLLFTGLAVLTADKIHKVGEECKVGNDTGIWHDQPHGGTQGGRCCINVTCPAGYVPRLCNNSNGLGVAECRECRNGYKPGPSPSADMHPCRKWTKCSGKGCIIIKNGTTTSNYEWTCDHTKGYVKDSDGCHEIEKCPAGEFLSENIKDCYPCPSRTFKSEPGYQECSPVTNCTDEEEELEPYTPISDTVCRNKSLSTNDTQLAIPPASPKLNQIPGDNIKIIAVSVILALIFMVCIAITAYCFWRKKGPWCKEILLRQSLMSTPTSSTEGVGNKGADSTSEGSGLTDEGTDLESLINVHASKVKVDLADGQDPEDQRMLTRAKRQMSPDSPRQSQDGSEQYEVSEGHDTGQGQEEFEVSEEEPEDAASNRDAAAQLGKSLGGAGHSVINYFENVKCDQLVLGNNNIIRQTKYICNGDHPPAPQDTLSAESQLPRGDRHSTENDEQARRNINDNYPNVHVSNLYTLQPRVPDPPMEHEGMETRDVSDLEVPDVCVIQQETGPPKDDEYFDQNVIVPIEETGPAKDYHSMS